MMNCRQFGKFTLPLRRRIKGRVSKAIPTPSERGLVGRGEIGRMGVTLSPPDLAFYGEGEKGEGSGRF